MKILVTVKRVVDYNVAVRVKEDGSGIDFSHVKMSINPFDEIAVEEAVRLKEENIASEVVVVSVGVKECQEVLRVAQALGANRAIHVQADGMLEPLAVAKIVKAIADEEKPDLIIMGKQAIDDDSNQTGQMLSALMNCSLGTFASNVKVESDHVLLTREVDAGHQIVKLSLPAVITADLRLNEPRYASLPDVMKARRKPLSQKNVSEFDIDVQPRLKILNTAPPEERQSGIIVNSVQELVGKLRDEANIGW